MVGESIVLLIGMMGVWVGTFWTWQAENGWSLHGRGALRFCFFAFSHTLGIENDMRGVYDY